ncbi:hypothetical protein A6M21_13710 [Desulfotomaculum copahuensis]|uniref:Uncharacterized protein n=1 Tax=Desulfotomaculum copahuensis TaxID=1838280 RepID=A0A1B7LCB1_9FIRM|nr:hypothetical protein A6M21_13710 [Desulfotomaculum copahuensis]
MRPAAGEAAGGMGVVLKNGPKKVPVYAGIRSGPFPGAGTGFALKGKHARRRYSNRRRNT